MRKSLLIFFLILRATILKAQDNFRFESYTSIGSSNLSFEFSKKFWTGAFLDSTLKSNTLAHLGKNNSLGLYSQSSLYYRLSSDTCLNQWFVEIGNYNYFSLAFSANAFRMVFEGNTSFEGKSADLLPLNFHSIHFMNISGGIRLPVNHSKVNYISVSAGPVLGYSYADLNFTELNYDAVIADTLKLGYNLKFCRQPADPVFKNVGFALNLGFENKTRHQQWNISINNLGFLHLARQTYYARKNDQLTYTGINIADFDALQSEIDHFSDSLSNRLSLDGDTSARLIMLPFNVRADFRKVVGKYIIYPSLHYIMINGFIPELICPVDYKLSSHWQMGTGVRAGGFSTPDLLLSAACNYDRFQFSFLYSGVLSAIVSESSWGYNMQLKLHYNF